MVSPPLCDATDESRKPNQSDEVVHGAVVYPCHAGVPARIGARSDLALFRHWKKNRNHEYQESSQGEKARNPVSNPHSWCSTVAGMITPIRHRSASHGSNETRHTPQVHDRAS